MEKEKDDSALIVHNDLLRDIAVLVAALIFAGLYAVTGKEPFMYAVTACIGFVTKTTIVQSKSKGNE